ASPGVEEQVRSFLLTDGTFVEIRVPGPTPSDPPALFTEVFGINDAGVLVGTYQRVLITEQVHGFRFDPATATFTTIDVPGVKFPCLTGINTSGQIVGFGFKPSTGRVAFVSDPGGTNFQEVTVPGIAAPEPVAITDDGTLAGNVGTMGFVFQNGVVQL